MSNTYGAGHVIRWSEIDVFLATMSSVKLLCPSLTLQDTWPNGATLGCAMLEEHSTFFLPIFNRATIVKCWTIQAASSSMVCSDPLSLLQKLYAAPFHKELDTRHVRWTPIFFPNSVDVGIFIVPPPLFWLGRRVLLRPVFGIKSKQNIGFVLNGITVLPSLPSPLSLLASLLPPLHFPHAHMAQVVKR